MLEGVLLARQAVGRHQELRVERARRDPSRGARRLPITAASTSRWNVPPITHAVCRICRLRSGCPSTRAMITSWIVAGMTTSWIFSVARKRPSTRLDGAVVDERAHDLLDVERIALRLLLDQLARRVRDVALAEEVVEQARARPPRRAAGARSRDAASRMLARGVRADPLGGLLEAGPEQVHEQDRVVLAQRAAATRSSSIDERSAQCRSSITTTTGRMAAARAQQLRRRCAASASRARRPRSRRAGAASPRRAAGRSSAAMNGSTSSASSGSVRRIAASSLARALVIVVVVADVRPGATEVGDRVEALMLARRDRAALAPGELAGLLAGGELGEQARLSRGPASAMTLTIAALARAKPRERAAQQLELALAADERARRAAARRRCARGGGAPAASSSSKARRDLRRRLQLAAARARGTRRRRASRAPPRRRRRRCPVGARSLSASATLDGLAHHGELAQQRDR